MDSPPARSVPATVILMAACYALGWMVNAVPELLREFTPASMAYVAFSVVIGVLVLRALFSANESNKLGAFWLIFLYTMYSLYLLFVWKRHSSVGHAYALIRAGCMILGSFFAYRPATMAWFQKER